MVTCEEHGHFFTWRPKYKENRCIRCQEPPEKRHEDAWGWNDDTA